MLVISPTLADGQSLLTMDTLIGFLPIAVFLGILYFVFRRTLKSPLAKLQQTNIEQHIRHMQRMEELLERIAVQLERQGK